MQSCCVFAVVAGVSASPALENLHIRTAQSHGMRVVMVCTSSKSSALPQRATWKRLALVAQRASTHHSRSMLAKNVPVCGGRCSGDEWSLMHLFVFLQVLMSTADLYSAARPIN